MTEMRVTTTVCECVCRSCVSGVCRSPEDEGNQRPNCLDSRQCSWSRRRSCRSASWVSISNQFCTSLTRTCVIIVMPAACSM